MFLLIVAATAAIGVLLWILSRRLTSDQLQVLNDQRRPASRIVGRGEFIDGSRRLEVALALTSTAFYYESSTVQASLDLEWIEEVDYDTNLATGRSITGGKVMRLRCHRQVFEFVLPENAAAAWETALPAGRRAITTLVTAPGVAEVV